VKEMANEGIIDAAKVPNNFGSTSRPSLWPLADDAGAHAHSQAHAALSDFIAESHGIEMTRGTQTGADWLEYLTERDSLQKVLNDFDEFYSRWLPDEIAAGNYPLLKGEGQNALDSYRSERETVHGCRK
jgi:hypothetical protein